MDIRRATQNDIPEIAALLVQVHDVHAQGRPDLFVIGERKYSDEALAELLKDDERPVFVACEDDKILGYAFCMIEHHGSEHGWQELTSIYIDDICVDERARGKHVGSELYHYVLNFARELGCHNVTLNVWECNPGAKAFYESLGMTPYKVGMEQVL